MFERKERHFIRYFEIILYKSAALHARYDRENLRAGRRRATEEALPGKAHPERQSVWASSCLLNDWCGWKAWKGYCIGDKKSASSAQLSAWTSKTHSSPWTCILEALLNAKVPVYFAISSETTSGKASIKSEYNGQPFWLQEK